MSLLCSGIAPTVLAIVDVDDDDDDDGDIYEYSLTAQTHKLMTLSRFQSKLPVYQNIIILTKQLM